MKTQLDSRLARKWAQRFTKQRTILCKDRLTAIHRERIASIAFLGLLFLTLPSFAHASPFDGMITNVQTLFTGPIATAGATIACVISGIAFGTGDSGAKRGVAGLVFGIALAIGAVNVVTWLSA